MKVFCITDFGAKTDGTPCTAAIQAAIDACFAAGGGEVTVPAGVFTTATVRLRSGVTLHLLKDACLRGSRDAEDYTHWVEDAVEPLDAEIKRLENAVAAGDPFTFNYVCARWRNALIRAFDANNIAVIGDENAVVDGMDCYDAQGEEGFRGPHAIGLEGCTGVTLRGYTVVRSANWAHCIFQCRDITVENVRVMGGHDGVHFRTCDHVVVKNCVLHTGDDCVAGFDNTDFLVEDCELNTACSGFRFGGTRVTVRRCRLFGPAEFMHRFSLTEEEKQAGAPATPAAHHRRNMLSAFTYFADDSRPVRELPGDFVVEDCTVENVDRLLHYNYSGNETYQKNRPLGDITFRNLTATGICMPLTLYGSPDCLVTATFENARIETVGDIPLMQAAYFGRITLNGVTAAAPRVRVWTDGVITGDTPVTVEKADEPFHTDAI